MPRDPGSGASLTSSFRSTPPRTHSHVVRGGIFACPRPFPAPLLSERWIRPAGFGVTVSFLSSSWNHGQLLSQPTNYPSRITDRSYGDEPRVCYRFMPQKSGFDEKTNTIDGLDSAEKSCRSGLR